MNKIFFILLLLLGFFLIPSPTYACNSCSANHSCKMEMSSKSKKHDCCSKKSKSNKKGCSGKCGQAMCSVSPVNIGITSSIQFEITKPLFAISEKEQNFSNVVSVPLDGYTSLWLIPKIG